jgi:hypothetical protein
MSHNGILREESISHTLFRLKLVLDSTESTSRTLVAHAEHDPELNRRRLYYVYRVKMKERKALWAPAAATKGWRFCVLNMQAEHFMAIILQKNKAPESFTCIAGVSIRGGKFGSSSR